MKTTNDINGNDILKMFKDKYNDIMNWTFTQYGTEIHALKAFDGDTAIASIAWNPVTDMFNCYFNNNQLITDDKSDVIYFLKL